MDAWMPKRHPPYESLFHECPPCTKITPMKELTTHERFQRVFEHRQPDRVPFQDYPWGATVERWRREGLPAGVDWLDYFGLDHVAGMGANNSPRFPVRTLEETDEYVVHTTDWGATLKDWKHAGGTPEFIDFVITSPDEWAKAKPRMTPTRDRVDWSHLKKNYPAWREKGWWVTAGLWFGFDVTHSWMVGTERFLMALVEYPEWCVDMWRAQLELQIALYDMAWEAGYRFDCVTWPDDLGYKHNQFMSMKMYRELLKPVHKRAVDWAHSKGAFAHLHSCGDVNPFVPEFVELGFDALNPLEVKAGMDPSALKKQFGDRLVLHGGINAVLWDDTEAISAEIARILPVVMQNGGYIFSSDHSIPSSVSFADFTRIVELVKKLGTY
jgi:uroporphyrinogen decarboxylase